MGTFATQVRQEPYLVARKDSWHALQCVGGSEKKIRKFCSLTFPEAVSFTPSRELFIKKGGHMSVQIKPFFPGYVLLNFGRTLVYREAMETVRALRLFDGVGGAVRMAGLVLGQESSGDDPVQPVALSEMEFLLELTADGEVIKPSRVIKENEQVRIISGPLRGLDGVVKKYESRKNRIKIAIEFLGVTRLVDLSAIDVTPVTL